MTFSCSYCSVTLGYNSVHDTVLKRDRVFKKHLTSCEKYKNEGLVLDE